MTNRPARDPSMPQSDWLIEQIYDAINRIDSEPARIAVARSALLAAQHRVFEATKKGTTMLPTEKEKELRRLLEDIYDTYMATIARADKATKAAGVAYKATKPSANALDDLLDGVSATLKRTGGR